MVLSNKKLKQKLRSVLEESLPTSSVIEAAPKESTNEKNPNLQVQSLKELLSSATQKPILSKREKRRKDLPFKKKITPEGNDNNNDDTQKEKQEIAGSDDLNEEKKKKKKKEKKRKREEVEGEEKVNGVSEPGEKKPVQKKKKKKKAKNKKKKQKIEKVIESNNGDKVEEPVKIDESQESVEIATKVYVGGIPYYSTEDDIRSFFESCGTITEIDCIYFPETGKFRGIAMINFKTEAAAKRALALDGADMGGLFLKIQPYKSTTSRPQKSTSDFAPKIVEGYNRVYVGNLSWDITEDDLKNLFSDCKVSSVRFGMDKETGEFRGYAHVDFEDSLSLAIALKLDQKEVCGRPARITCAVPKKDVKTGSKLSGPKSTNRVEKVEKIEKVEKMEKVENDNNTTVSLSSASGKKRRTCYECGVAGHISTDCPKKKQTENVWEVEKVVKVEKVAEVENDSSVMANSSRGKKRRTCYECGVAGHISTDCPKKKQAENVGEVQKVVEVEKVEEVVKVENDNSASVSSSRGKKRRTCYECGVSGHISTDCPKKTQAVDPQNVS